MTSYILKEIICNKYNRSDEERFNRSILFVIQNTKNGNLALFQLDRIAKKVAALRCNNRSCGHRMSIEHAIPTVAFGNHKGRKIASEVTKADLMDMTNWMKVFHNHSKLCKMTGPTYCNKTEHAMTSCESKDEFKIIKRKFRSFVVQKKVEKPESSYAEIIGDADNEYNTNRYADYKGKDCGIDDANEIRAMQRAHLESHGENLYDP